MTTALFAAVAAVIAAPLAVALDNGAAPLPPMGTTTWNNVDFHVNDTILKTYALMMVSSGLREAGYNILWLDDGWPACSTFAGDGGCTAPAPRAANGTIVPDPAKFPSGVSAVADFVHGLGLKLGIYTAPHATTCGGFTGSLGHEALDAATFAAWGVDAVKLDAGCQNDCGIHDGCLLASLARMRDGLNATGRRIIYYVDDGNPTTGPKVYNPQAVGWAPSPLTNTHFARSWAEHAVSWGPAIANMYKIWYDREDSFSSLMDNAHQQANFAWFQACGSFINTDMMTVGTGGLSRAQERAEVFLYAALASPLLLAAPLARLTQDPIALALVLNPEIIAANQDPDCVMATLLSPFSSGSPGAFAENWAGDRWVRPLSTSAFLVVMVNRDPVANRTLAVAFGEPPNGGGDGDFFPAGPFPAARVRDLHTRRDLGLFSDTFSATLPPNDAVIVTITPQQRR